MELFMFQSLSYIFLEETGNSMFDVNMGSIWKVANFYDNLL